MSNENPPQKTGGLIVACVVAILMGIRFSVKGIQFMQIEDVRTMGVLLLLCGLVLVVLSIVLIIRGIKKNKEKE